MDEAGRREVAERAERFYEERIRAIVEREHFGKELLVESNTGDYEIVRDRDDFFDASARLKSRHETPRVFIMRIGYRALARIGGARWRSDEA